MNCGRCLPPCTSSITNQVECGTGSQQMYKIKYVADRDFFVFKPLFPQNKTCSCDKKLHGKSSLHEGLKVKSGFVVISFSSVSIHQANEADSHSAQSLTFCIKQSKSGFTSASPLVKQRVSKEKFYSCAR